MPGRAAQQRLAARERKRRLAGLRCRLRFVPPGDEAATERKIVLPCELIAGGIQRNERHAVRVALEFPIVVEGDLDTTLIANAGEKAVGRVGVERLGLVAVQAE